MQNPGSAPLPFSDPEVVATNRDGHMTGSQQRDLWFSGAWRMLIGVPGSVAAATWAVVADDALPICFGIGALAVCLYISWRGFSHIGDAVRGEIGYSTDRLRESVSVSRNSRSYWLKVGPVNQQISRATYAGLPTDLSCHVYYGPGSRHLLSLEPAENGEPSPAVTFGGDAKHAWDRLRWRWIAGTVAVLATAAGAHLFLIAHPAQPRPITGTVTSYSEYTHKGSTSRYLHLAGSQMSLSPDSPYDYEPTAPSFYTLRGKTVTAYVNGNTNRVIALVIDDQLYAGVLYRDPGRQKWNMQVGGVVIALVAILTLMALTLRRRPASVQGSSGQLKDKGRAPE